MYTSSKLRRLRRIQRVKKQRHTAFIITLVFGILVLNAMFFGFGMNKTVAQNGLELTVKNGDTLWTIAREYKPSGKDMRQFVREISQLNNIDDASIYCGQKLVVPRM